MIRLLLGEVLQFSAASVASSLRWPRGETWFSFLLFDEVPQFPAASGVSSLRRSRGFKWISDSPSLILALRPRLGPFVPVIGVSGVRLRGGVTRHTGPNGCGANVTKFYHFRQPQSMKYSGDNLSRWKTNSGLYFSVSGNGWSSEKSWSDEKTESRNHKN